MTRSRIFTLIIVFVLGCAGAGWFSTAVASSGFDWSRLSVSASDGKLTFFDSSVGRVYVYSIGGGDLLYQWQVEEMGKDLKQVKAEQPSLFERNLMMR